MVLRKVPGALALGLLASLIAHGSLYGAGHVMGGDFHALLLQAAAAGGLGLLIFFGSLAWSEARIAADGSILAARLRARLPGLSLLLPATALWYAAAESIEPHHAGAPAVVAALGLVVASWLILFLARGLVRALAGAVIAVSRTTFAPRTPSWAQRPGSRLVPRRLLWARRRYARPPPIAIVLCA